MMQEQRISPAGQFFILMGLFCFGIILGGILEIVLGKIMLGLPVSQLEDALTNPANATYIRVAQAVVSFCVMALPVLILGLIKGTNPFRFAGFSSVINLKQAAVVILIAFAALFAGSAFSELNEWIPIPAKAATYFKGLEDTYNDEVMAIAQMKSVMDYVWSLIIIALLPAIMEEMFFRGAMQQVMIAWTKKVFLSILITSIFFSAIHASYYGFLTRLFLGMLLGYIFYYSKNLWLNVLVHFLNNAIGVTQIYLLSTQGKLTADSINDNPPLYYGIVGIIAIIPLMILFKKLSDRLREYKLLQTEQFNIH